MLPAIRKSHARPWGEDVRKGFLLSGPAQREGLFSRRGEETSAPSNRGGRREREGRGIVRREKDTKREGGEGGRESAKFLSSLRGKKKKKDGGQRHGEARRTCRHREERENNPGGTCCRLKHGRGRGKKEVRSARDRRKGASQRSSQFRTGWTRKGRPAYETSTWTKEKEGNVWQRGWMLTATGKKGIPLEEKRVPYQDGERGRSRRRRGLLRDRRERSKEKAAEIRVDRGNVVGGRNILTGANGARAKRKLIGQSTPSQKGKSKRGGTERDHLLPQGRPHVPVTKNHYTPPKACSSESEKK